MAFTREQVRSILGDAATDEAVSAILNAHSADIGGYKGRVDDLKAQLRDANAELGDARARLDEASKANMTAEEQLQTALAEADKVRAEFMRKTARLDAEQVFVEAGLSKDDYADVLDGIVTEDAKATVKVARSMAKLVASRVQATEEATRREVLGTTPRPDGNDGDKPVTKADFDAMTFSEQMAFKAENPDAAKAFMKS